MSLRIVGLMSGTSTDGIDAALVEVVGSGRETKVELQRSLTLPYSAEVRGALLALTEGEVAAQDVAHWHVQLAELLAVATLQVLDGQPADLIASHGHTVLHLPRAQPPVTVQIGSAAVLAARTGITVVSDFRTADVAAGGEGAPLVSFVDDLLFRHPERNRALVNIGGIANLTWLPASWGESPLAFDTGPGNALLDAAAERFLERSCDLDGTVAAAGAVNTSLLLRLLSHPYFSRRPPKSTGREEFGVQFLQALLTGTHLAVEDLMATLTAFTAETVAAAVRALPVDEVIVSGGGRRNGTLMTMLRQRLEQDVLPCEAAGIDGDAKEAVAFAVLANQTVRGLPANLPNCTGAAAPAILGSITPGGNYRNVMEKLWT